MKKYLFIVLALLFMAGVANAAGIPTAVDPKNEPEVWTQMVYNGSGSTIQSSIIVIWDYDTSNVDEASNDDRCSWIKVPTEADDIWTAGVTAPYSTITDGSVGSIIIKGPTWVLKGASGTVNQLVGATTTTGATVDYAAGTDDCAVGRVVKASPISSSNNFCSGYAIVDVLVSCSD